MLKLTIFRGAIAPLCLTLGSLAFPVPAPALDLLRAANTTDGATRSTLTPGAVASNPTCPGTTTGDRRVASGSVSTRWIYWVLQDSARQYYLTYWAQHDCTQWHQTSTYSTQRAAYEDFMCQYIQERCNPQ